MISIACLEVHSFDLDFLDISWHPANTEENIAEYTFQVFRCESPEGPFEAVSTPLAETFSFRDETVDLYALWRIWYYCIEIVHTPSGESSWSPVGYMGFKPDLVAMEMSRLYQGQLQRDIGIPVQILKRRTSGPRCPACYDPIRKRAVESDCLVCLGTSQYRGGFMEPIGTFVNESPSDKLIRLMNMVVTEPSQKNFDTAGYPYVVPGDMIVDVKNRRYTITEVRDRSKRGFTYRQIIQATEIPKTDTMYKVPVDVAKFPTEAGEMWPRPARYGQLYLPTRHVKVKGRWNDDFL